jgi:hypothetical protein
MATKKEEEVPVPAETEVNEEVDNEEGERYSGGEIPRVSPPEDNKA